MAENGQQAFQFVEVTSPHKRRSQDTERIVRTHVTTRFHRKQRLLRNKSLPQEPSEATPVIAEYEEEENAIAPRLAHSCPTCHQIIPSAHLLRNQQAVDQVQKLIPYSREVQDFRDDSSRLYSDAKHKWMPVPASNICNCHSSSSSNTTHESDLQNEFHYYPMKDTFTLANPTNANPFDPSFGIRLSSETHQLVDKFISTYFEGGIVRKTPLHDIIRASMTYAGLYHSNIFTSLGNQELLMGRKPGPLTLTHRGYTVYFINESLKSPDTGCTDEAMLAVISLVNAEALMGNAEAAEFHMQGLEQMVKVRGGLQHLGYDGMVRKILIGHDYFLCLLNLRTNSRFSDPDVINQDVDVQIDSVPDFRVFTLLKGYTSPNDLFPISREIIEVLGYLGRVISISQMWQVEQSTSTSTGIDPSIEALINGWLTIGASLHALPSAEDGVSLSVSYDYMYEACRIAGVLLSDRGLKSMKGDIKLEPESNHELLGSGTPGSTHGPQKLKAVLELTNLYNFWHPIPGALIWCLAIGVTLSPKGPLKSWFLVQFSRIATTYSLVEWDGLERSLRIILSGLKNINL